MTADANIIIGIEGRIEGGRVIKRTLDDVSKGAKEATNSVERLDAKTKSFTNSATQLSRAFNALIFGAVARTLVNTIDNFNLLEARVKNSTRSIEEFDEAIKGLRESSARTGAEFATSVEVFQRISFVRDEVDATIAQMVTFTDSVQKLGVVSGASTQNLNAGLRQLGQSLSSEIVRAEEFNSIMENIPAVGKAIADEFGVTTGQLRNLVINGEVLSQDVFAAILNQTQKINEQFDKMPMTMGRAINELILKLQASAAELDKMSSFTKIFISALKGVGIIIEALVNLIKGFGNTIKAFFSLVIAGIIDAFNSALRGVENMTNYIIDAMNSINPVGQIGRVQFAPTVSRGDLAQAAVESAKEEIAAAQQGFKDAFDSTAKLFIEEERKKTSDNVQGEVQKISKDYAAIASALGEGNKKIDKEAQRAAERIKAVTDELRFNTEQLYRTNTEQEVYNNLRSAGVSIDTDAGQTIAALTRSYEEQSEALERQKQIADELGGAFEGFFKEAIQGTEGFKGAIRGLIGNLADMAFQMAVIEPLKNSIFGATGTSGIFGSIFGGLFGNAATGQAAAIARGVANPALFGPGFDSGGTMILGGQNGIDQNMLSLNDRPIARVGRGEVLSVSPRTSGAGGGVVVNQSINISTGVKETVAAEITAMLPQIQASTQAAIEEASLRGIGK